MDGCYDRDEYDPLYTQTVGEGRFLCKPFKADQTCDNDKNVKRES